MKRLRTQKESCEANRQREINALNDCFGDDNVRKGAVIALKRAFADGFLASIDAKLVQMLFDEKERNELLIAAIEEWLVEVKFGIRVINEEIDDEGDFEGKAAPQTAETKV